MSHQFFHVVLPSHALQLLAASFHLLLRMSQTAAQLLVCDGQGLVAANNGHHRGLRAVIEVCCRKSACGVYVQSDQHGALSRETLALLLGKYWSVFSR